MDKMTSKLIGLIGNKAGNFNWCGWKHKHSRSRYFELGVGNEQRVIGVMTITPKCFLRITLKFCYAAPWREPNYEFNPDKDLCWYEFRISDEFMTSGKKTICDIVVQKGSQDFHVLDKLFAKIRAQTVFSDDVKKERNIKTIDGILKEFQ